MANRRVSGRRRRRTVVSDIALGEQRRIRVVIDEVGLICGWRGMSPLNVGRTDIGLLLLWYADLWTVD